MGCQEVCTFLTPPCTADSAKVLALLAVVIFMVSFRNLCCHGASQDARDSLGGACAMDSFHDRLCCKSVCCCQLYHLSRSCYYSCLCTIEPLLAADEAVALLSFHLFACLGILIFLLLCYLSTFSFFHAIVTPAIGCHSKSFHCWWAV